LERSPAPPPVQLTVHSMPNSFKLLCDYRDFDAMQHGSA
jgi:hypothetical protein